MALTTVQNQMTAMGDSGASYEFVNRIINGAMVIDQRNAGASVTTAAASPVYSLDRWILSYTQLSKYTVQQNAGSVTPPSGFSNYLGATSTSAYSVVSSDVFLVSQRIEGFNWADMAYGTANAKTATLSFWVRSSLTGTFGGALRNATADYTYPFSYNISSANTWEQKTITIAGPTAGTWVGATNGIGANLIFSLGSGSSVSGPAGSWAAATYTSVTGATSLVGTNGATWYVTGVQLEKGTTASAFDYRDYTREFAMCQRYYQGNGAAGGNNTIVVGQAQGSGTATSAYVLPVVMRTTPALTVPAGGTFAFVTANGGAGAGGTITIAGSSNNQVINFYLSGGSGLSAGNATSLVVSYHGFQLSAEL